MGVGIDNIESHDALGNNDDNDPLENVYVNNCMTHFPEDGCGPHPSFRSSTCEYTLFSKHNQITVRSDSENYAFVVLQFYTLVSEVTPSLLP